MKEKIILMKADMGKKKRMIQIHQEVVKTII
jgi:hypothetical protein